MHLIKITANSVPSKCTFLSMKTIYSITRNRLTPTHINKLLFININTKVLNRAGCFTTNTAVEADLAVESEDDAQEVGLQYTMAPIDAITVSGSEFAANQALNARPGPEMVDSP
jgi:hypothetical protein